MKNMMIYLLIQEENTEFFTEENDENESSEISQSDNETDSKPVTHSENCTYVYTEDFQYVCAEDLVSVTDGTKENPYSVEIVEDELKLVHDAQILDTIQSINENTTTLVNSTDTVELMAIYEDIQSTLNNVYDYLNLFVGLYFVGWIFAQLNSWRRNNK